MFADISSSTSSSAIQALAERDINTSSPSKIQESEKYHSTQQDSGNGKMSANTTQNQAEPLAQSYISPSDTIQSPTTKKLSEMKGKRYANVKPQSLFARTVKKEGMKNQERMNKTDV